MNKIRLKYLKIHIHIYICADLKFVTKTPSNAMIYIRLKNQHINGKNSF
jgi:hypothetical protein